MKSKPKNGCVLICIIIIIIFAVFNEIYNTYNEFVALLYLYINKFPRYYGQ